jgi:hypothetical protein
MSTGVVGNSYLDGKPWSKAIFPSVCHPLEVENSLSSMLLPLAANILDFWRLYMREDYRRSLKLYMIWFEQDLTDWDARPLHFYIHG